MATDSIKTEVVNFVRSNYVLADDASLTEDQSLIDSGIIDSTGILELVGFLEARYKIKFRDDELTAENFSSIASISRFIAAKTDPGSS